MSLLPTLSPLLWGMMIAIPVGVILLYFLKLRREPMRVPSTYLWAKTVEDLHVNSLLQRLRQNLLLFLQLLLLAAAAFALLRPGWRDTSSGGRRMIFLLDNSASMQAVDVKPTRFDEAKRRVHDMIDNMDDDDTAMLIAFSDRADVRQGYTSDTRRLLEELERINVTNNPTDLSEALRAAAGLANPGRSSQTGDVNDVQVADALPATLYIYSDGCFPPVVDFSLGNLTPKFERIASDKIDNLGILTLAAQRNMEKVDQVQTLARVKNFGDEPVEGTVSLLSGEELLDAVEVKLAPDEESSLTFDLDALDATELRLVVERTDQFGLDNVAHAVFSPTRQVSVLLVTTGNRPLELALKTKQAVLLAKLEVTPPSFLTDEKYLQRTLAGDFDLVIFDRCIPEKMPQTNSWWIGAQPPEGEWKVGEPQGTIYIADVDRVHPIMRYMELYDLKIVDGAPLTVPTGGRVLLTSDVGPLLAIAPRDGYQDLVLGMPIMTLTDEGDVAYNTDWPIQRSWPVLVLNVLQNVAGAENMSAGPSVKVGSPVTLRPGPEYERISITAPSGEIKTLSVNPGGMVDFADTFQTGIYRVHANDKLIQAFSVNLFSARESDLKTPKIETEAGEAEVEGIVLGYDRVAENISGPTPTRRELWRWLLMGALGILMAEWIVYNRRVGI